MQHFTFLQLYEAIHSLQAPDYGRICLAQLFVQLIVALVAVPSIRLLDFLEHA